eukprot:3809222-Rhodomonas_salina.1
MSRCLTQIQTKAARKSTQTALSTIVDHTRRATLSHVSLTRISTEIDPNYSALSHRSHTLPLLRCPRRVASTAPDSWGV